MKRELTLLGGIGLVLVAATAVVALSPSALGQPEPRNVQAGYLSVAETTIAPEQVSGGTATLTVDTRLSHGGGPSENVSVLFRATNIQTGLVETTQTRELGTITGNREVTVIGNLSVARKGGYRIESIVYRDGERIDTGGKEVRGVGTLQPAYARVPVEFHRFGNTTGGTDLPPISFTVDNATDNRTRLNVSTYLTNAGDEPVDDLRLSLVARQADSNIVADRAEVPLRNLTAGATATPTAPLTVPEGYNYYLDAILWHEGTIVGTTRVAANLNPSQNFSVSPPQSESGLQVSDFESEGDRATGADGETSRADGPVPGVDASGPGFGIRIALVVMLVVGFGVWRHSQ